MLKRLYYAVLFFLTLGLFLTGWVAAEHWILEPICEEQYDELEKMAVQLYEDPAEDIKKTHGNVIAEKNSTWITVMNGRSFAKVEAIYYQNGLKLIRSEGQAERVFVRCVTGTFLVLLFWTAYIIIKIRKAQFEE